MCRLYQYECDDCGIGKEFASEEQCAKYSCPCGGNKKPLITIELEDMDSIPKVSFDGKDITGRCRVTFKWITRNGDGIGGAMFEIEYIDDNGVSHNVSKRVGVYG